MNELGLRLQQLRDGQTSPLPLTKGQANAQAARMRARGLSYSAMAHVMGVYHGNWRSPEQWRYACRNQGAEPRPRGRRLGVKT